MIGNCGKNTVMALSRRRRGHWGSCKFFSLKESTGNCGKNLTKILSLITPVLGSREWESDGTNTKTNSSIVESTLLKLHSSFAKRK
jgi:hypothetical protein